MEANAPAILVGGHFANWEVLGLTLTQSTTPFRITYRRINNPYIDARVREEREAYGTKFLVQKSTHRGGRELFEALRKWREHWHYERSKIRDRAVYPIFRP